MKKLRFLAALFVTTSAAFLPLIIFPTISTALETSYTLATYNTALSAAQTAVTDAQSEVDAAQAAVDASAVYHETTTVTGTSNVVINGTFDDASAWSNIGMGSPSTVINSYIPRVYNGILIGSYSAGVYVSQSGTFSTPTRNVTFSYSMSNNNTNDGNRLQADYYRVEFRTYSANGTRLNYYNIERTESFGWTTFTHTPQLSADAVRWDIGFRFQDNGYWNGNFAGSIDNVSLVADTSVVTPAYTSYDSALVTSLNEKKAALVTAQQALDAFPALTIDPPTNLTGTIDGGTVTLNWNAPISNLIPERYAIMWTDGVGGWGIASTTTSSSIDASVVASTAGWDKDYTFKIRSDHDTGSRYSSYSNEVTLRLSAPIVPVIEPSPSETPTATESPAPSVSETPTASPSPSPEPSTGQTQSPEPQPTPIENLPSVNGTASEGQELSLSAPIGKVFTSVIFASYGTPNGYTIGDCHAPNTVEKIAQVFLGRAIATIMAVNDIFGDPCGGVYKQLTVVLGYGDDATPTPEPSPSPSVEPSPESSPQASPEPSPSPLPTQTSLPTPSPTPTPDPVVVRPEPTPTPEPQPSPQPTPTASPDPEPSPEPSPEVTPEPSPTPSPEETPTPEPSPSPEPEPSSSAEPEPTPKPTDTSPEPPTVEPEEPTVAEAVADALADGKVTEEERAIVAEALVASLAPGEALSAAAIEEAGITYADLPPETPVEVRTDAEGNPIVITAEVADALTLVENPAELLGAVFSDPGKALLALFSVGADMSPTERKESQQVVVASVIVGTIATLSIRRM